MRSDPRQTLHDYDNVDELLVWETVHYHLPNLLDAVNRELAGMPEQNARGDAT
jgi:uncharacterized protein with HEPN domain